MSNDGEDLVNFCGLLKKHELYLIGIETFINERYISFLKSSTLALFVSSIDDQTDQMQINHLFLFIFIDSCSLDRERQSGLQLQVLKKKYTTKLFNTHLVFCLCFLKMDGL